jgi:ABC-type antimicrobial peptide transport system, ATPase component
VTVILSTSSLTKVYGNGHLAVRALSDVTLAFARGRLTSILGPSGSGKSTFLNIVGGLDAPTSGSAKIGDIDLTSANEDELARIRSEYVGFVFPGDNLLPHQTARQNIEIPMRLRGEKPDQEWYSAVIRTMGIVSVMDDMPEHLPRGVQQRVAIARALLGRPAIILADEPTRSLDTRTSLEILELLRLCVREFGQTVLMATQDLAGAALAERVVLFSDGTVAGEISDPTPASVLTALEALNLRSGPG